MKEGKAENIDTIRRAQFGNTHWKDSVEVDFDGNPKELNFDHF